MRTFKHAKLMASTLRAGLAERGTAISHSESLEIVARQFGFRNWNILAARIAAARQQAAPARLPEGWFAAGTAPENYRIGAEPDHDDAGKRVGSIQCLFPADDPDAMRIEKGFATLMQSVEARSLIGQRLRFSAQLKTRDVSGHAAIWMRVDDDRPVTILFDNLTNRESDGALTGTSDWTQRHIVFQIPDDADSLHFGILLSGMGSLQAHDLRLEEAATDERISATRQHDQDQRRKRRIIEGSPRNLDFSTLI
ncbi:hypothetical protein GLI01_07400 [Gluconacetobacter liquefaciens]|uniref:glyoxalase superfamily protein n=1 Tax=Gluconacetobacter liquefaciens TaxID=89584 RepID=UPI001143C683|nr:glyoxalase superfamily protein [Gluconacetobacter liquefaciens]GBR10356.1 hypothetical protein AA0522_2398 [Gluconacetobacter liquefaciens NRIC 0522]GEB36705.1 hypothetical protein GLI01_07400 [Gluconacetobacter liquefaciens]